MKEINPELKQAVQKWKKNATQLPHTTGTWKDQRITVQVCAEAGNLEEEIDQRLKEDLSDHRKTRWYDWLIVGVSLGEGRIGVVERQFKYPPEVKDYLKRHGLCIIRFDEGEPGRWEYED